MQCSSVVLRGIPARAGKPLRGHIGPEAAPPTVWRSLSFGPRVLTAEE